MKDYKKDIIILSIVLILVLIFVINQTNNNKNQENDKQNNYNVIDNYKTTEEIEKNYLNNKDNSVIYQDSSTIEQLKEEYKIEGDTSLYQVETENDGRKVINVKTSLNFKVAFAGMLNDKMPNLQEIDSIYDEKYPKKNGVWINDNSREKILNYLNKNDKLKASYTLDEYGYLQQIKQDELTEIDKKIKKLVNGQKQYIISISSECYMIDVVTGKIIEYRFNDLEPYQTYEYFEDNNKMIIFLSENKEKKLTEDEIFNSIIRLLDV